MKARALAGALQHRLAGGTTNNLIAKRSQLICRRSLLQKERPISACHRVKLHPRQRRESGISEQNGAVRLAHVSDQHGFAAERDDVIQYGAIEAWHQVNVELRIRFNRS